MDGGRICPREAYWRMNVHLEAVVRLAILVLAALLVSCKPTSDVASTPESSDADSVRTTLRGEWYGDPIAGEKWFFVDDTAVLYLNFEGNYRQGSYRVNAIESPARLTLYTGGDSIVTRLRIVSEDMIIFEGMDVFSGDRIVDSDQNAYAFRRSTE